MPTHETLSLWENFYVIVGSSAGALTGLQFVVVALIPDSQTRAAEHEINTFATPTIVLFGFVLLVSAILSAPWPSMLLVATTLWVSGGLGILYSLIVLRRARRTTVYKPVLEDWLWYCIFPLFGYLLIVVSAGFLVAYPRVGLFGVGSAALVLLFVGIHNAWDSAMFIAISNQAPQGESSSPAQGSETQ
jgi:hypothetical protein